MTRDDILKSLVSEYRDKIRESEDITLAEFRQSFEDSTGIHLGEKRARKMLSERVASGEFISLIVIDRGRDIQIWRKTPPKGKKK